MKLAEALQVRKDLKIKLGNISKRLENNARVQEGEAPLEDPKDLLNELERTADQLEDIIGKINLANAKTLVDGHSLTELMAKREVLSLKISYLKSFSYEASDIVDRATGSEIKIKSTVSVPELQKKIDSLSKEYREVELKIQETNWITEI